MLLLTAIQKVPPRVVFVAQSLGIILSWLAQTAVNVWALNHVEGICHTNKKVFSHTLQGF